MFDRAARGCVLFCLWCAQDLEANHFWESIGFVPIAFRAGSRKKKRMHIFWEKRTREGDTTTPWWYPSQTGGGMMGEDRLVFPIPPGTHWSDVMPVILPDHQAAPALPAPRARKPKVTPILNSKCVSHGALRLADMQAPGPASARKKREKPPKQKNHPVLVAKTRELRDRYLEKVNSEGMLLQANAKYELHRALEDQSSTIEDQSDFNRSRLLPGIAA
jgi:hypothetical protein